MLLLQHVMLDGYRPIITGADQIKSNPAISVLLKLTREIIG